VLSLLGTLLVPIQWIVVREWYLAHCRLEAAFAKHTAAWSEVFLVSYVGNLLGLNDLRAAVALWVGVKIFTNAKHHCV